MNTPEGTADSPLEVTRESRSAAETAFRQAAKYSVIAYAIIALVALPVGYLVDASAGLWGALIGLLIGVFFSGLTVASMILTANSSPLMMMGTVMGIWLGKMVILIIALIVLNPMDFYNRNVFAVVLMVSVIASLWADVIAVQRGRILNVETVLPEVPQGQ